MIGELGENLIPMMAIGCTCFFLTTWVLMATIESIFKTRCQTRLKELLIENGCSASEIEQVIQAGEPVDQEPNYTVPVPPVKPNGHDHRAREIYPMG